MLGSLGTAVRTVATAHAARHVLSTSRVTVSLALSLALSHESSCRHRGAWLAAVRNGPEQDCVRERSRAILVGRPEGRAARGRFTRVASAARTPRRAGLRCSLSARSQAVCQWWHSSR